MSDDPEGKVIDLDAMVLSAHDFWCHVARRARGVMRVVRRPNARDTHISNPNIAIALKQQVLWLNVPMDDSIAMHVFKTNNNTSDKELGLLLCKTLFLVVMVPEITTCDQVSDQVDIFKVNERIKHIDQEPNHKKFSDETAVEKGRFRLRVFELCKEFALIYNRVD